jgi:hypothetical protein
MQLLNDPSPWWGMSVPTPHSMVDLIAGDTISPEAAGVLWWAVERGASVLVAADPQGAGKTTTASALFSFLPDGARAYVTSGPADELDIPTGEGPCYLLVNELSNHVPIYLSGPAARRAFALLRDGVRMIGTLHADSAQEAVTVLERNLRIPAADIALIDIVVVLRVRRGIAGLERRIVEISLVKGHAGQPRFTTVAAWDAEADALAIPPEPAGTAALAAWAGEPVPVAMSEIEERARFLVSTGRRGVHTRDDITAAVRHFRRTVGAPHATA